MKKFDFKLKGLLKIREFKETQVKNELGVILREINELKEQIDQFKVDIAEAYHAQEELTKQVVDSQMLTFFPYFIKGKEDHIETNENRIFALNKKYEAKLKELHQAKADVSVIENLKEKGEKAHKKEVDKKLQEVLEEHTSRKEFLKRMSREDTQ